MGDCSMQLQYPIHVTSFNFITERRALRRCFTAATVAIVQFAGAERRPF